MTDDLQTEISKKDAAMQFLKRLFVFIFVGAGGLFILLFLMSFLFMFEGLAYEDNLAGGYVVQAGDMRNSAAIFRETEVVPPMVFGYGWNEDFIIAKRHWVGKNVDIATAYWYLIEIHTAKVHGPLTEQQFTGLRGELGVPEELTFTKTIRPD